jgi:hypothetical protein
MLPRFVVTEMASLREQLVVEPPVLVVVAQLAVEPLEPAVRAQHPHLRRAGPRTKVTTPPRLAEAAAATRPCSMAEH